MEIHDKFTEWAIEKGVQINGIRPHRFEGRGLGIIAERDFKVRGRFFALVFLRVVSFVLSTWLQVNHSCIHFIVFLASRALSSSHLRVALIRSTLQSTMPLISTSYSKSTMNSLLTFL
jgi:hypothetical protein